jgi:hypothetical protein
VVAAHGATLVDLSAAGTAIATHPEYLASDGFNRMAFNPLTVAATARVPDAKSR